MFAGYTFARPFRAGPTPSPWPLGHCEWVLTNQNVSGYLLTSAKIINEYQMLHSLYTMTIMLS